MGVLPAYLSVHTWENHKTVSDPLGMELQLWAAVGIKPGSLETEQVLLIAEPPLHFPMNLLCKSQHEVFYRSLAVHSYIVY